MHIFFLYTYICTLSTLALYIYIYIYIKYTCIYKNVYIYIHIYICIYIFMYILQRIYREYLPFCSTCNPMQLLVFCKHVLIFWSKYSNSLTLKVA